MHARLLAALVAFLLCQAAASPGSAAPEDNKIARRLRLVVAGIVCLAVIGLIGYLIGSAQVMDAESARQEGTAAGERRGAELGQRDGYEQAYAPARERAFRVAYRSAYRDAYVAAFEQADLNAPSSIPVSAP